MHRCGDSMDHDRFLSRLFGGRPDEPAWIEAADLQRRLTGGPVLLVDVRQPEEFTAPPGHLRRDQRAAW